jgi:hypothetical protein
MLKFENKFSISSSSHTSLTAETFSEKNMGASPIPPRKGRANQQLEFLADFL